MASTQKNININNFDFSKIKDAQLGDFEYFAEEKEKETKQKIQNKPTKKTNKAAWFAVLVLFICLLGLGTFTLDEMRNKSQLLADYNGQNQIAGVQGESTPISPITGDWFSILPKEKPPAEFVKTKNLAKSEFLENRQASNISYLAQVDGITNTKLQSGIEISVVEYDNRYTSEQLANLVLEKLGGTYEIKDRNLEIPKEIKLTQIRAKNNSKDLTYYTTATTDNYYIIKVYKQTLVDPRYDKINKFTDSILPFLYLN